MNNILNLEFHHFEVDKPGGINVQFKYDIEAKEVVFINIQCSWDTGLPSNPTLKFQDGKWKLYYESTKNENGKPVTTKTFFNSPLSYRLVDKIFEKIHEHTPHF